MFEMAAQPNNKSVVKSSNGVVDDSQDDSRVSSPSSQYSSNKVNFIDDTSNSVRTITKHHSQNNKGKI